VAQRVGGIDHRRFIKTELIKQVRIWSDDVIAISRA
jgi:hypothetical protein